MSDNSVYVYHVKMAYFFLSKKNKILADPQVII